MASNNLSLSSHNALSARHMLELANAHLENARKAYENDSPLASAYCDDADSALKRAAKPSTTADPTLREEVANAHSELRVLRDLLSGKDKAQGTLKKAQKWGVTQLGSNERGYRTKRLFFAQDLQPPVIPFKPPGVDKHLNDIPQLVCCLGLLQQVRSAKDILDPEARQWFTKTKANLDEQERLRMLATDVVRAYKRAEIKDTKIITEVLYLAPVLENDTFQDLLIEFCHEVKKSILLNTTQLDGLARLLQGAKPKQLKVDDLNNILMLLIDRLQGTREESSKSIYQLLLATSCVLDSMVDAEVEGIDRVRTHEPLLNYLKSLENKPESYLVYQAAYAYQALLCVPDNEKKWQAGVRRAGKVIQGVSGLVSAVKGLDLNMFVEGLGDIRDGVDVVSKLIGNVVTLTKSGKDLMTSLKEGLSFDQKRKWYSALRGADTFIRDGKLATFRELVYKVPCRSDPAFQWGVCQRLGEIAANPLWESDTRREAIVFLGEIYRNDAWGQLVDIKQWILDILRQLSTSENEMKEAKALLDQLCTSGDTKKQPKYPVSLDNGQSPYPLTVASVTPTSWTLLDHAQNRPDVESSMRQLKKRKLQDRGEAVYIQPQAKASLEAADDTGRPLTEMVKDFLGLDGKRKDKRTVFLILGDPGAGKSTFSRELEFSLWKTYKPKTGRIPLHINLPAIDKPEHDMVAKQLRRLEFTESQIRELKTHRQFILICDGYDESQQTHNLYMSNRLNQPGEWDAQMVISCRSEYLGSGYHDRFQPAVDRNQQLKSDLFQEAVITPFSPGQVQSYIDEYVSVPTNKTIWQARDYTQALDLIPSLKELVKNPFLMTLSLEVLPRIVDPGEHLSTAHITRVALYDHFIKQWLERGKKRLEEKDLNPQTKAAFESLSREGFTQNGLDFLKRLSTAIYKEQDGHPIVKYSRYKDEGTWKADFFSHEDEKQLLLEVCPMTRNGNQHRFIHRSLLEFGFALAVFDPQDSRENVSPVSASTRRQSVSSILSFEGHLTSRSDANEPDLNSPLSLANFPRNPSILQFLEERAQLEPVFKQQLLSYIEHSKKDKKWRIAAANSITILVRAGVQFNGAQLNGIQIPGADLSHGVFDSAQLQRADLRKVNFHNAWLRHADLSGGKMRGVQFGELPFLTQDGGVQSCVYSLDGKSFAIALSNGKINVYSTSNWTRMRTLEGHSKTARSVVYSPKGTRIASCSEDGTVRLWNIDTGNCHVFYDQSEFAGGAAFSPTGDLIATASSSNAVEVWDVESGTKRKLLIGHTDVVNSVTYSPHGMLAASASEDMTIRLWDLGSEECLHTLYGHTAGVCSVVYSPKGNQIASSSFDMTVRLWNVGDRVSSRILCHDSWINSVVYSPQEDMVASASDDMKIRLWDARTGVLRRVLTGHDGSVTSVAFSPQGDLVASTGDDTTVRFWDIKTEACHILVGHSARVNSIAFSPKDLQVASGSDDNSVRLWDVAAGTSRHVFSGHTDEIACVRYSAKGSQVASCSKDGSIRLWDVETGSCRHTLQCQGNTVRGVVYSADGDYIASGCNNGTMQLWSTKTGACLYTLSVHSDVVNGVAYAPSGDRIASASDDTTVQIWHVKPNSPQIMTDSLTEMDPETKTDPQIETDPQITTNPQPEPQTTKPLTVAGPYTLKDHTGPVLCVVFSPSGAQVASGSGDSTVRLWNAEDGDCQHVLVGHDSRVNNVAYSPTGDRVASASHDNTIRLWDTDTGECCHIFVGHTDSVFVVRFSPQGNTVASGGKDRTVRLWNAEGRTCKTLAGHTDIITCIEYSTEGEHIVSGSGDCSARLWDVVSGQCQAVIRDSQGWINDIAWGSTSEIDYLVVGCHDGSMRMWQIEKKDQSRVSLRWRTTKAELTVKGITTHEMEGLSELNVRLLEQRGVVDSRIET